MAGAACADVPSPRGRDPNFAKGRDCSGDGDGAGPRAGGAIAGSVQGCRVFIPLVLKVWRGGFPTLHPPGFAPPAQPPRWKVPFFRKGEREAPGGAAGMEVTREGLCHHGYPGHAPATAEPRGSESP